MQDLSGSDRPAWMSHPNPRRGLSRRRLMLGAGAAATTLPTRSRAYTLPRYLRLGFTAGHGSALGAGSAAFAQEVGTRTKGAWQIDLFANNTLGGEAEMIEAVQAGEVDIAYISTVTMNNLQPSFALFDIPFLFHNVTQARAVIDGPIGQSYLKDCARLHMVGLAWGENGMRHLTNSRRPVQTAADLRGLKLRVPQSNVMIQGFDAMGAEARPMPFPALYGALESQMIDGEENPISLIVAGQFARVQRYLSMTAHVYSPAMFLMSLDACDRLTPAERDIFIDAARTGGSMSRQAADEAERSGLGKLRSQGMQIIENVDRDSFIEALQPLRPDLEARFGANFTTISTTKAG